MRKTLLKSSSLTHIEPMKVIKNPYSNKVIESKSNSGFRI